MEEAMNIKTSDATNASQINLNPTPEPRDVSRTSVPESSSQAGSPAPDSIALSNTSGLVQQALSSVSDARTARVNELQQLFQSNQYHADSLAVSRALISAHLAGE